MKLPSWVKPLLVLALLASVAALGLAYAASRTLTAIEEKVTYIENQQADLAHPDGATVATATRLANATAKLAALEKTNAELSDRVDALLLKLHAHGRRLDALEAGDLEDLGLDELIDQKLGQRISDRRRQANARRRPPLDRLVEHLDLTERQKQQIATVIDGAKDDVLDLMTATRDDDRSLMDDLGEVVQQPGTPEEKRKRILSRMFEASPPGSDESYFTEIIEIRSKAIDDFSGVLTSDQHQKFRGLGIDLFGVKTGHSPFVDYVRQAMSGEE